MSLFLTEDELIELTGYKRRGKQIAALDAMAIKAKIRPADGFPLVERNRIEGEAKPRKRTEPDFDAAWSAN